MGREEILVNNLKVEKLLLLLEKDPARKGDLKGREKRKKEAQHSTSCHFRPCHCKRGRLSSGDTAKDRKHKSESVTKISRREMTQTSSRPLDQLQ